MLKKKNNKVTDESLFCSSCLFCKKKKKKQQLSGQTWNTYMSEKPKKKRKKKKTQDGSEDSFLKFENGVTYAKFMLAARQTPVASTLDYYTCSRSCARLLLYSANSKEKPNE